jgi:hypothetical protein
VTGAEAVAAGERAGEPEGQVPAPTFATREEDEQERRPEAPAPAPAAVTPAAAAPAAAEAPEAGTDADEEEKPEVPAGALVDDGHQGEARRGWWSRWVRKDS